MKLNKLVLLLSIVGSMTFAQNLQADDEKTKDKEESKEKTVAELIKDKTFHEGFLNLYQDPKTGSMMLSLTEEQLNKPMVYFVHTVNGVLDAGHFKGAFRETKLLEFRKHFDRIEIISSTPRYYLDEKQAISRSKGTNISPAILSSMKIEAQDKKTGRYLVKVDPVFLGESIHKVSPYPRPEIPGQSPRAPSYKVGKLSKDKTKYMGIRSYPKNSDVVVEYVFDNDAPSIRGGIEISDARTVVVQMQHSFIELPENDFKPRRDDARIGYFTQQFDDLTSNKWAPYKDVINRWKLVKKDPAAALSEPVEPIVWWIENTTPVEWRDTIQKAALQWNIAFEKAGFKNALQIKIQPDDADWDAGDIRYNVLRWTASPRPPFGGYGPSVANPLTGQIIASDIMLEYVFMKNRWLQEKLHTDGVSMEQYQPVSELSGSTKGLSCSAGYFMHNSMLTAGAVINANGGSELEKHKLVEQALTSLILHELGHTLGLNHNMKASQRYNAMEVHDASITQGSLTASVMDYAPVNIAPPGITQGDYSDTKPGSYDMWAIEYGYSPSLADDTAEEARLSKILARSTESGLAFGNDADDMRRPGLHIDPRVMIGDMSNDAIEYSRGRMELVKETLGKLKDRAINEGESYQELVVGLNVLLRTYFTAANVSSRYVGGVHLDRAVVGQQGATQPYTPVSKEVQKKAIDLISEYLFAPGILKEAEPLYAYSQVQRRSFNKFGDNEDPKLHEMILNAQRAIFDHVLHTAVLQRMSDTALYGNEYALNDLMEDLTSAVFAADKSTDVTTHRQNLQHEYVNRLITISGLKTSSKYDYLSRAAATYQLQKLRNLGEYQQGLSVSTKAHRSYLRGLINEAFGENS